mmetsp:Transcript_38830/g.115097  ORF Transcript_38830/g.115097 Transcript_38830/m.115097 type:complete len:87 (+) Transcript_38830:152-412(+)
MGAKENESATAWPTRPDAMATKYMQVNMRPNMYDSSPEEKLWRCVCSDTIQHSKHENSIEVAMPPVTRPIIRTPYDPKCFVMQDMM